MNAKEGRRTPRPTERLTPSGDTVGGSRAPAALQRRCTPAVPAPPLLAQDSGGPGETHTILSCPAHVYVCESVYRTRPSPGGGSGTGALSYIGPESCNGANASCIGTDSPVRRPSALPCVFRIASYISYRQSESSTLGRNFLGRRQAPATSTASNATHTERTTTFEK